MIKLLNPSSKYLPVIIMLTYAQAGVDDEKTQRALKGIISLAKATFEFRKGKLGEPKEDIGHYAALMDFGDFYLAMTTDGVGTKTLVAEAVGKYDTIGIDMVAMNVNDLICLGAEPVALVDYLAVKEPNDEVFQEIAKGLYEGAKQSGIAIVGGETAVLPELGIHSNGLTLARKLLIPKYGLEYEFEGKKIWEYLLEPTRIIMVFLLKCHQSAESSS
ncbi:MAG: phosphoribosylformylglycinamidine cyclo-ligase [Thermococcaceae archaeon]|nr:phosphoribosylformylglycinamidine cyclo-ligase [Thermococcaceae archaeon]